MSENENKQEDNKADEIDEILVEYKKRTSEAIISYGAGTTNYKQYEYVCKIAKGKAREELARVIEKEYTENKREFAFEKQQWTDAQNGMVKHIAEKVRGKK